jgi:hypothetical protein
MENNQYKSEWKYNLSRTAFWNECPTHFEIGEEVIHYSKRRVIKYKDGFSNTSHKVLGPDIDAISFLSLTTRGKAYNLFCSLEQSQITSPMIKHFAEQERCNGSYTDPDTGLVLWKRLKTLKNAPTPAGENEYEGAPFEAPNSTYHWLNGGFDSFQRVLEKDGEFFNCLILGVERGICQLSRLDLCVDFSENMMKYVKSSIEKGYYDCKGLHPYGYGWLGGKRMKGPIGRRSEYAKSFEKERLVLHSVYFGNQKNNDKVLFFYDKTEESLNKWDSRWPTSTRIEARLLGRNQENVHIMLEALRSYNDATAGWKVRMKIFVQTIMDVVRFTTKKRVRAHEKGAGIYLAPWWLGLITTLLQASLEEKEIEKMKSLGSSISEPELHMLLRESIKSKNLSRVLKKGKGGKSFQDIEEAARSLCSHMSFRDFYRKVNLQRSLKHPGQRNQIKEIFSKSKSTRVETNQAP